MWKFYYQSFVRIITVLLCSIINCVQIRILKNDNISNRKWKRNNVSHYKEKTNYTNYKNTSMLIICKKWQNGKKNSKIVLIIKNIYRIDLVFSAEFLIWYFSIFLLYVGKNKKVNGLKSLAKKTGYMIISVLVSFLRNSFFLFFFPLKINIEK